MTHNEYHAVYTTKAKRYTLGQATIALADCHETLKLWGAEISTEYSTRLWAEIDAMRERIAYLETIEEMYDCLSHKTN
jgi:hypothetical protein